MDLYEKLTGMKIFFDLDGTLIDSKERLYRLFQHLVPASTLTFDEYWDKKKNKIDHSKILKNNFSFSEEDITRFQKNWMEQIELPKWLAFDKPFEGVTEYLVDLKKQHDLYLVTARQFENRVFMQLADYGWTDIFVKVFVTAQKMEKVDLVKNAVITDTTDWFVGDTGKDIEAGKSLGLQTAAVLSGFLNREKLIEYKPSIIINNIINFNPIKNKL
jgi:phosphoglycolate phosphatase